MTRFLGLSGFKKWFIVFICLVPSFLLSVTATSFNDNFVITWGNDNVQISNDSLTVQLTLDRASGSGFASKNKYLFGSVSMKIKLVPGNSAGTVTAYYMSSDTSNHDEIDFEFLGNLSGQPYTLQTNVYASGVGNREQRIQLWFDPSADFHNYSILWNHKQIMLAVDSTPVRVFKNNEAAGVPYPKNQAMTIFSSLWNGDDWATQGGRVKIDWSKAPFVAAYQSFEVDACMADNSTSQPCTNNWWDQPQFQTLTQIQLQRLRWVRQNYMIYDYCNDTTGRFPKTPVECPLNA